MKEEGKGISTFIAAFLAIIFIVLLSFAFYFSATSGNEDNKTTMEKTVNESAGEKVEKATAEEVVEEKPTLKGLLKDKDAYSLLETEQAFTPYLDENGELPANAVSQIYDEYMEAGVGEGSLMAPISTAYKNSFVQMKSRLGLLYTIKEDTLGEVAQFLTTAQIDTADKFELINRYGVNISYDSTMFQAVYLEQLAFLSDSQYDTADTETLLLASGALYALLGSVNKSNYDTFEELVVAASDFYKEIAINGINREDAHFVDMESEIINYLIYLNNL